MTAAVPDLISLCLPTRRPDGLRQMIESAVATAAVANGLEVVAFADVRDLPDPHAAFGRFLDVAAAWPLVTLLTGERPERVGPRWNACARASTGGIVMLAGDDLLFRTPGWDERVRAATAAFAGGIGLVYADDLQHGAAIATHPLVTRGFHDALGFLWRPEFAVWFGDPWLQHLAAEAGRIAYLPDVVIEHRHWGVGKAEHDETYRRSDPWHEQDTRLWESMRRGPAFREDLARLRAAIGGGGTGRG